MYFSCTFCITKFSNARDPAHGSRGTQAGILLLSPAGHRKGLCYCADLHVESHVIPTTVRRQAMARLPELQSAMNLYFEQNISLAGTGLEVLPGVVELLTALQVSRCTPPLLKQ